MNEMPNETLAARCRDFVGAGASDQSAQPTGVLTFQLTGEI